MDADNTAGEMPVGRFSLALHVCMTPKNDTSMALGSDEEEADGGAEPLQHLSKSEPQQQQVEETNVDLSPLQLCLNNLHRTLQR